MHHSRNRQGLVNAVLSASTSSEHIRANAASHKVKLTKEDLTDLDREFPPPKSKTPLPIL
jgi:diketogulonate reductase-like aldo/keto reductase